MLHLAIIAEHPATKSLYRVGIKTEGFHSEQMCCGLEYHLRDLKQLMLMVCAYVVKRFEILLAVEKCFVLICHESNQ